MRKVPLCYRPIQFSDIGGVSGLEPVYGVYMIFFLAFLTLFGGARVYFRVFSTWVDACLVVFLMEHERCARLVKKFQQDANVGFGIGIGGILYDRIRRHEFFVAPLVCRTLGSPQASAVRGLLVL